MPYWIDHEAHKLRLQDVRHDVEHRRLVNVLKTERSRSTRFYSPALAGLGRRLVAWGSRLQDHHGPMVELRQSEGPSVARG